MREQVCPFCGLRAPFDPTVRCLACGGEPRPATRCYGCARVVPQDPTCVLCRLPTVAADEYPLARALRLGGEPLPTIAGRLTRLSHEDRRLLAARYASEWAEIDDLRDRLERVLACRLPPSRVREAIESEEACRSTPSEARAALLALLEAYGMEAPSAPPFPRAVSKAILEAAPVRSGRSPGIDAVERATLLDAERHYGRGPDAAFFLGKTYLALLRDGRNLGGTVFELADAALRRPPGSFAVPVELRADGVLWAEGFPATPFASDPWSPERFRFVPFREGP